MELHCMRNSVGRQWAENWFLRHIVLAVYKLFGPRISCMEYKEQRCKLSSENDWGSVDKTEQALHLLVTAWETENFGTACIDRIRVIQLRSDHAWVIVTIAYLGRRDDSCSAGGDKRPSSRLVQITPGLNSMYFERCSMEDKESRSG